MKQQQLDEIIMSIIKIGFTLLIGYLLIKAIGGA